MIAENFIYDEGDGLPFCLAKIDVSGWAMVNPMTLDDLFKLFWNLESISWNNTIEGDATVSYNDPFVFTINNSGGGEQTSFPRSRDTPQRGLMPHERVCGRSHLLRRVRRNGELPSGFFGAEDYEISVWRHSRIAALYDGEVSNEDNLLGYGSYISSNDNTLDSLINARWFRSENNLRNTGYTAYTSAIETLDATGSNVVGVGAAVTLGGIPFVRVDFNGEFSSTEAAEPLAEILDFGYYDYA